jgi:PAS domain S-box-containing protein
MEELTGYSRDELVNTSIFEAGVLPKDNLQRAMQRLERTIKGEQMPAEEYEVIRKDGSRVNVEVTSITVVRRGKVEIIAIARDITERKKAEEEIRESEERLKALIENAPDAIFVVDYETNFLYVSKKMEELTGYSRDELTSTSVLEAGILSEDGLQKAAERLERILKGEQLPIVVNEVIRKDGSRVTVETTSIPVARRGKVEIMSICRDITERKRAEEELRESEMKYSALVEQARDMVFIVQGDTLVYCNSVMTEFFGYTNEELLSMPFTNLIAPEELDEMLKIYEKQIAGEQTIDVFEATGLCKDGTRIDFEVSSRFIQYKQMPAMLGIARDITQRKKAEEERKELEAKAQFASRMATVGQMASGIAHEINNPLTSVIGFSQLIMEKDASSEMKRYLELINEGSQRVAGIVNRLLIFSQQRKPERVYTDVNELISSTLDLRGYSLETSNIRVTTQLESKIPKTMLDRNQMQEVFLNIIINAEKEMKSAHRRGKLSIRTESMDNVIRVYFKDDGPGIPKNNLDKIFDPFFTTREVGEGTGLGLSICHGMIIEHGGQIYVESEPGKGATFIVELPVVAEQTVTNLDEPASVNKKEVSSAKILVVDDEPAILKFLSAVLENEGHEVETVDNAKEALDRIKNERYRLILSDIKMPQMSGMELYESIQNIAQSLLKRVIFLSGDVIGTDTRDFLVRTKAPYIMKPFDKEHLINEVNRMLTEKN